MSSQSDADGSNSRVAMAILDFLARKTQQPISYTFFRQVSGALGCLISDPETMTGTEFIKWCERATISELDLFGGQTISPQQTLISKIVDLIGHAIQNFV